MRSKSFLKLLLLPITLSMCGCNNQSKDMVKIISDCAGMGEVETIYFPYQFDINNFVDYQAKSDLEMAKIGLLFCANIAPSAKLDFKGSEYVAKNYTDYSNLYKQFQLEDFETKHTLPSDIDPNDGSLFNLSHKTVTVEEKKYDICFISFEDSGGDPGNWSSNFDIGDEVGAYESITGEHPDWTNKKNHKGFDVTANRSVSIIKEYISSKLDQNSQQILYVFGHSRGGAVANLAAAKLIDLGYKTCCYGFASPRTTTDENYVADKYKTIHNYVCDEDLVTRVLKQELGFDRYGETIHFSVHDYAKSYKKVNGFDIPEGDPTRLVEIISSLADSRDEIYVPSAKYQFATSDLIEEDEIPAFVEKYTGALTDQYEVLREFVEVVKTPESGKYKVSLMTSAGFYTTLIGLIISDIVFGSTSAMVIVTTFRPYMEKLFEVAHTNVTELMGAANMRFIAYTHYYQSYLSYIVK